MKTQRVKVAIHMIIYILVVSILLLPIGFIYLLNNGNPYTHYVLNKKLPAYLEQRGYSDEEILQQHTVEPKLIINKDYYHAHYMVIFKDEPDVTYYYGMKKREQSIDQFCEKDVLVEGVTTTNTEQTKYSEETCVSMFANR